MIRSWKSVSHDLLISWVEQALDHLEIDSLNNTFLSITYLHLGIFLLSVKQLQQEDPPNLFYILLALAMVKLLPKLATV
jgi:hypothetical protein